jgi:formylglycine-generating enzyme required for sulfatase activity
MRPTTRLCALLVLAVAPGAFASDRPDDAPQGMRRIPAGRFTMGSDADGALANERPAHPVELHSFCMDEHDVTNAEFRAFVAATKHVTTAERPVDWEELKRQLPPGTPKPDEEKLRPGALVFTPPDHAVDLSQLSNWWTWTNGANWRHPRGPQSDLAGKDSHPVVQVSWDDAVAYAKWAGKRLPTEAEWEYAARGGREGTRYYWGDELVVDGRFMANTFTGDFPFRDTAADGWAGSSPVGAFPPNGYGLFDMAGNVWNWCSDYYAAETHAVLKARGVCCDPVGPARGDFADAACVVEHVIKGGSFLCSPAYCESYRPSARRGTPFDTGSEHVGFRCVKDVEAAKEAPVKR